MAEGTSDPRQVLGILKDARGLVGEDWGSNNLYSRATGGTCASVGISRAARRVVSDRDLNDVHRAAHVALLEAANAPVGVDVCASVYAFNDAQISKAPVLAAFDKAIRTLENEIACDALMAKLAAEPEPTPQADATIEVILAVEECGTVLARQIVATHPQMDEREVRSMCCSELFSAAQDAAWACDMGVLIERGEPMGLASTDEADAGSWS